MNSQPRPKISRKPIVLLVSLCLIISAVLIPVGAHLPRWVEIELVLGAWWGIWVIALTTLLYRGHSVDDDIVWKPMSTDSTKEVLDQADWTSNLGYALSHDCGEVGIAVVGIILAIAAIVAFVELIIPAIALLLLASIGGMFARAVNDTHDCEGRFGVSLFWGTLWATVYIGPVAAVAIWVANYLAHRS